MQDSVTSRPHWTPFLFTEQGRAISWSRVYVKGDHGLEKGRLKLLTKEENLLTCDRQLSALNISKNTKHVNVMVVSRGVIMLSLICKKNINTKHFSSINHLQEWNIPREGLLGSIFAEYAPLASHNPYPIIVYMVARYRPHLSHFWANVIDIFS